MMKYPATGAENPTRVLMRRSVLVCLAALGFLCPAAAANADEPVTTIEESSPIAQLRTTAFPFECHRLHESGNVDSRDETDPAEVEYISYGLTRSPRGDLPSLPEKVFDIFPRFPKLRSIRLEYFLLDPEKLKRLKEIPNLKSFSVHISRRDGKKSFNAPEDLDFLAGLPNLEELSLTSADLTDDLIVKLLPLKSLKTLRLDWNNKLTQAVMPTLEKMPALESLRMHDTSFAPPPIEARRFAARLKSFYYSAASSADWTGGASYPRFGRSAGSVWPVPYSWRRATSDLSARSPTLRSPTHW